MKLIRTFSDLVLTTEELESLNSPKKKTSVRYPFNFVVEKDTTENPYEEGFNQKKQTAMRRTENTVKTDYAGIDGKYGKWDEILRDILNGMLYKLYKTRSEPRLNRKRTTMMMI